MLKSGKLRGDTGWAVSCSVCGGFMRKALGAAAAALTLASSMPANAACWNNEELTAATVREFQSMLMVATLRCQVAHHDMTAEYNGFLRANKALIQRQNDKIKAHFVRTAGPVAGQKAYDQFTTHMANGYGADSSSADVCDNMSALAREATLMAGNVDGLLLLAEREGLTTELPGGSCGNGSRQNVALNGDGRSVAADH